MRLSRQRDAMIRRAERSDGLLTSTLLIFYLINGYQMNENIKLICISLVLHVSHFEHGTFCCIIDHAVKTQIDLNS